MTAEQLPEEPKGACPVCGCEELNTRELWTCECPAPRTANPPADIVERLRAYRGPWLAPREAAYEIERLRAENKRLRVALERHGRFRDETVAFMYEVRLAVRQGLGINGKRLDDSLSEWLDRVDGPKPVRAALEQRSEGQ